MYGVACSILITGEVIAVFESCYIIVILCLLLKPVCCLGLSVGRRVSSEERVGVWDVAGALLRVFLSVILICREEMIVIFAIILESSIVTYSKWVYIT